MTGTPTARELSEALGVLNNIIEQTNDYNKKRMEEYGITQDFADFVGTMSEEEINTLTLGQINSYLAQYGIDQDNILQIFSKGDNTVSTMDKWKDFFAELRKAIRDMNESLTTREELKAACDDVFQAQNEFLQSEEYKEGFEAKVAKIRELAEKEEDETLRKQYLRKLNAIEQASDLSFLLTRLDDPKINKKDRNKELNRLVDIFFDKNRSQYLMERYQTNIQKMHISPDYHINLYDLEEKFLPEDFYPLNNFFLFVVISYIAYINPEDEVDYLYAVTILNMMGNMLLGAANETEKDTLLRVIRDIDSRIIPNDRLMEKFRQENTTWKEHPIRKELDAKRAEMKYRLELIEEIKGMLQGFGAKLVDGTTLTAKNASTVLRKMDTAQIEGIRDEVKVEYEKNHPVTASGEGNTTEADTVNEARSEDKEWIECVENSNSN